MKIRSLAIMAISVFVIGLATQMAPAQSVDAPDGADLTSQISR